MDLFSPIFEFEQLEDLFPFSPLQELTVQDDLLLPLLEKENVNSSEMYGNKNPRDCKNKNVTLKPNRKRKSLNPLVEIDEIENHSDHKNKKIMHREIERQRRKEMGDLNLSLKSLLPPINVKGRKSLSDNLHETVNYIRHMQKKIEELSKKRHELKKSSSKLTMYVGSTCLPCNFDDNEADDVILSENIQIALSTGLNGEVALSRLLEVLIQEGLNVINCTSTNLNERLVHTIESKVSEGRSINPYELQKTLRSLVSVKIPSVYNI